MMMQAVPTQDKAIVTGLGEIQVSKDPSAVLTCLGLGSCVSVCAYDPIAKAGGMAHVVLPSSEGRAVKPSAKYADMAIPMLIEEMKRQGALRSRLVVKLTGGAELSKAAGMDNAFKIGEKNQAAVREALARESVKVAAEELGGNKGRTARMYVDSGRVTVASAGSESIEL
jgi:chemotaxis protein CheD